MRTLLTLALLSPVAFGQDEDTVPVAPAPRLKTLPTTKGTGKSKVPPPVVVSPKVDETPKTVTKVEPTPAPMPKTTPTPDPAPKVVAKVDPPTPPEPKAAPPVEPKAEPKTDAKSDAKSDTKDEKPAAAPAPGAKPAEPSFNDWTAPLYAVIAYGVLAVLVVLRSFAFPPKE